MHEKNRYEFLRSFVQVREDAKRDSRGWCGKLQNICRALLYEEEIVGSQKYAVHIENT